MRARYPDRVSQPPYGDPAQPAQPDPPPAYQPPGYQPPAQQPAFPPPAAQQPAFPPPAAQQWPAQQQPAPPPAYQVASYGFPPEAGGAAGAAPARGRAGLVATIALGVALLLCLGGGTAAFFLVRQGDDVGKDTPAAAVNDFLVAVYTDQDAAEANRLVCSDSRDSDELTRKIEQIKEYRKTLDQPRFTWADPTVSNQGEESATVDATVKILTADERTAEERLTFTVVKRAGWLVCEVRTH